MAIRLVVVCEARADQQTGCVLADRVICEGVDWIEKDVLDDLRLWCGLHDQERFLLWKNVSGLARQNHIRKHGHFDGEPGKPDARTATLALLLVKKIDRADGVLLLRDDDCEPVRREGLNQARNEAKLQIPVVIGLAHANRECWVIAGFQPNSDDERKRLETERQNLGFDPTEQPQKLTAKHDQDKLSAKRVLNALTQGDQNREQACCCESPLSHFRERGKQTGLPEYLDEVQSKLMPLFITELE